MLNGSLCGLGGLTPYPVQSAMRHFREDFERSVAPALSAGRRRPEGLHATEASYVFNGLSRSRDAGRRRRTKLVTLEIDGTPVTVPEGTSIMRAAALGRQRRPEALRHRHAQGVRLVPPVPGRDRRPARATRRRARRSSPTASRSGPQSHEAVAAPQQRDGALPLRPSGRLRLDLRERPLRSARHGRRSSASPACGTASTARTTCAPPRTRATPTSPSISPNASSARAACGRATKSRGRWR